VRRVDPTGVARVVAADALDVVAELDDPIDLLYLDADGNKGQGKGIYLEILLAARDRMPAGSLVLAHNSVNGGDPVQPHLDYVRDPANCGTSLNIVFDPEGLEATVL